ncbi:MAG: hypothetical protein ACFFG0_47370 [Candidatus Thorarchaeota archaeon]
MDIFIKGNYEEETSPSGTHKKIRINENQIERIDIDSFYDLSEKISEDSFNEFEITEIILADFGQEDKLKLIKEIILEEDWEFGDLKDRSLMIEILNLVADELDEILEVDISYK